MVNLEMILSDVVEGVMTANGRYSVADCDHVMDTVTGVEYHLYPEHKREPFKITHGADVVITGDQLTAREAGMLYRLSAYLQREQAEHNRARFAELHKMRVDSKVQAQKAV